MDAGGVGAEDRSDGDGRLRGGGGGEALSSCRGVFSEGVSYGVDSGVVVEGLADYEFGGEGEKDGGVVDFVAVDWGEVIYSR